MVGSLALAGAILDLINACAGTFAFVIQYLAKLKLISCLEDENSSLCSDELNSCAVGFSIAVLVCESVQAFVCCLLLHGIRKERFKLMVPYMIWSVIRFCTILGLSVFSIIYYALMPLVVLMLLSPMIILGVIETVYLLFIHAQYREVKRAQCEGHAILEEEFENL